MSFLYVQSAPPKSDALWLNSDLLSHSQIPFFANEQPLVLVVCSSIENPYLAGLGDLECWPIRERIL